MKPVDMSVYERLVQDDVRTIGYFPAERGVFVLALIGGEPHLGTVDTMPLKLERLSEAQFLLVVTRLLAGALEHPGEVVIAAPDLFPEALTGKAHDLRVLQQLEPN